MINFVYRASSRNRAEDAADGDFTGRDELEVTLLGVVYTNIVLQETSCFN